MNKCAVLVFACLALAVGRRVPPSQAIASLLLDLMPEDAFMPSGALRTPMIDSRRANVARMAGTGDLVEFDGDTWLVGPMSLDSRPVITSQTTNEQRLALYSQVASLLPVATGTPTATATYVPNYTPVPPPASSYTPAPAPAPSDTPARMAGAGDLVEFDGDTWLVGEMSRPGQYEITSQTTNEQRLAPYSQVASLLPVATGTPTATATYAPASSYTPAPAPASNYAPVQAPVAAAPVYAPEPAPEPEKPKAKVGFEYYQPKVQETQYPKVAAGTSVNYEGAPYTVKGGPWGGYYWLAGASGTEEDEAWLTEELVAR